MSLRTLGSSLSSCLLVAGLFGACVGDEEDAGGAGAPSNSATTQQLVDAPPHAEFSVVCIDRTCFPNAETSSDDVFIANYAWQWGDGAVTTGGSSASAPSHTYAAYGSRTIVLTVTDSIGQTGSVSHGVTLIQPPTAAFQFSCSGLTCHLDSSPSSGPASITGYHWDWDDETTTDTASPSTTHVFAAADTYRVHLTVTDTRAQSAGITKSITVP